MLKLGKIKAFFTESGSGKLYTDRREEESEIRKFYSENIDGDGKLEKNTIVVYSDGGSSKNKTPYVSELEYFIERYGQAGLEAVDLSTFLGDHPELLMSIGSEPLFWVSELIIESILGIDPREKREFHFGFKRDCEWVDDTNTRTYRGSAPLLYEYSKEKLTELFEKDPMKLEEGLSFIEFNYGCPCDDRYRILEKTERYKKRVPWSYRTTDVFKKIYKPDYSAIDTDVKNVIESLPKNYFVVSKDMRRMRYATREQLLYTLTKRPRFLKRCLEYFNNSPSSLSIIFRNMYDNAIFITKFTNMGCCTLRQIRFTYKNDFEFFKKYKESIDEYTISQLFPEDDYFIKTGDRRMCLATDSQIMYTYKTDLEFFKEIASESTLKRILQLLPEDYFIKTGDKRINCGTDSQILYTYEHGLEFFKECIKESKNENLREIFKRLADDCFIKTGYKLIDCGTDSQIRYTYQSHYEFFKECLDKIGYYASGVIKRLPDDCLFVHQDLPVEDCTRDQILYFYKKDPEGLVNLILFDYKYPNKTKTIIEWRLPDDAAEKFPVLLPFVIENEKSVNIQWEKFEDPFKAVNFDRLDDTYKSKVLSKMPRSLYLFNDDIYGLLPGDYRSTADMYKERINFINNRGIQYLIHFTSLENLESILNIGLKTRKHLEDNNIAFNYTDENRIDNVPDSISLSVSFPNYKMLYHKNDKSSYVILVLDAEKLLRNSDCAFNYHNAAANSMRCLSLESRRQNEMFYNMFEDDLTYYNYYDDRIICKREHLCGFDDNGPEIYTTDPQAEILCLDDIPAEYIVECIFYNAESEERYSSLLNERGIPHRASFSYFGFGPYCNYPQTERANE